MVNHIKKLVHSKAKVGRLVHSGVKVKEVLWCEVSSIRMMES